MTAKKTDGLLPFWFYPDGNEKQKTAYKIKPLTGMEAASLLPPDMLNKRMTPVEYDDLFKACLIDWKNQRDINGKTVKFEQDNFSVLSMIQVHQITAEIIVKSYLTGDEIKNS
jgi:hypothetical protein